MFRLVLTTAVLFACSAGELTFAQQGGGPKASGTLSRPTVPADFAVRDKDLDERVGRLVEIVATKGPFSGIVAVAREGTIVAAWVAGSADVEHGTPMRLDTPMRIASVTKMFTATAVLKLRDAGLVELDAPVRKYLPDAPAAWSKVTVRQLLSHRSGLGDYSNGPAYDARRHLPATSADLWKMVVSVPPRGEPGGESDYCNSNYVVLGVLIERMTDESYDAALRRIICEPLALTGTAVDHANDLPARAVGYRWTGHLEHAAPLDATNCGASGSLRSTASDLARFAHALSRPGFLSDQTRQDMFHSPDGNYALGCYVGTIGKQRLIAHGGGFDGFSAYLGILPDSDLCAIVLSNIEQTRAIDLCQAILQSCTGEMVGEEQIPEPVDYIAPPRVVTAEELRRYAGEYQSELGVLKIAVDGDHLTLHGAGDPKPEPLVPGDKAGMFQIHGPAQLKLQFQTNGNEPARTVELIVRGKKVVGTRSR